LELFVKWCEKANFPMRLELELNSHLLRQTRRLLLAYSVEKLSFEMGDIATRISIRGLYSG
jgi:hypothetical protein